LLREFAGGGTGGLVENVDDAEIAGDDELEVIRDDDEDNGGWDDVEDD